jgi:ABC-2 type transport system ATP-binding protein
MYAIETSALTRRFRHVEAVRSLNLQVETGAIYALMGPNGAGKSTLIKMLMNLLHPSSGWARLMGENVSTLRGPRLADIGYVSENQKLPEWMSVGAFLGYLRPFYPAWNRELEERLVDQFDLPLKQKLKHLSRGVKMKVALASVLAHHPRVIILDEPLSGLDPLVRDDLIQALIEQRGSTTVLISSHDLAEIDNFATHVGYMDGGSLRVSESIDRIRQNFRRIEAASPEGELVLPPSLPPEWREFNSDGTTARWAETEFDRYRSMTRIHEALGEDVLIRSSPMALRDIFLTLARKYHKAGREGDELP